MTDRRTHGSIPPAAAPAAAAGATAPDEEVIDASGHFHIHDAPVDLSHYTFEAWVAFGFFWILALTIFYQFFTRYVLNDSAAWTEEIARYLLICMVFVGISAMVHAQRHIHVDLFYRLVPPAVGRAMSALVDLVRIVFFAYATVLTWEMMGKMENYRMTIVDLPMNVVYAVCMFGFACSALRSVQVALLNWRRGFSVLERPEIAMDGGGAP